MKNTTVLRNELSRVYKDLQTRKIDTPNAKIMVSVANAQLKSAAIEADYNKFLNIRTAIPFLTTPICKKK